MARREVTTVGTADYWTDDYAVVTFALDHERTRTIAVKLAGDRLTLVGSSTQGLSLVPWAANVVHVYLR